MGDFDLTPECTKMSRTAPPFKATDGRTDGQKAWDWKWEQVGQEYGGLSMFTAVYILMVESVLISVILLIV